MIGDILKFTILMISVWLTLKSEKANRAKNQKKSDLDFETLLKLTTQKLRESQMSEAEKIHKSEDEANRQISEIQASNKADEKGN